MALPFPDDPPNIDVTRIVREMFRRQPKRIKLAELATHYLAHVQMCMDAMDAIAVMSRHREGNTHDAEAMVEHVYETLLKHQRATFGVTLDELDDERS